MLVVVVAVLLCQLYFFSPFFLIVHIIKSKKINIFRDAMKRKKKRTMNNSDGATILLICAFEKWRILLKGTHKKDESKNEK